MTRFARRWRMRLMISTLATSLVTLAGFGLTTGSAQAAVGGCTFPTGGDWFAVTCYNTAHYIQSFQEEYAVPKNPSQPGASFSIWGGLQDKGGTGTVLQGVLTWNGSSWSAYPEYNWNGGDVQGNHLVVQANDTIISTMTASECSSAGACVWRENVTDTRTGQGSTSEPIGSDAVFTQLLGGVLEVRSASGCLELPASDHIAFRDLKVVDSTGASPSPTFLPSTPDKQCSMKIAYGPTSADFTWTP